MSIGFGMSKEKLEQFSEYGIQLSSEQDTTFNWEQLPNELSTFIFLYLPVDMLFTLSLVNQRMRLLAGDNFLWKMKYEQLFPNPFKELNGKSDINWRNEWLRVYENEMKLWPRRLKRLAAAIIKADSAGLEKMQVNTEILGADNENQMSLLALAKKMGNQAVLDYLYQQVKKEYLSPQKILLKKTDRYGHTLFYWLIACNQGVNEFASLNNIKEIARQLEQPCDSGVRPIHWAASEGRLSLVEAILQTKADLLESTDDYQQTALSWAAAKGHSEIVNYLLRLKAKVEVMMKYGRSLMSGMTPLHWAAKEGHVGVVKLLIGAGANINARTQGGVQPLHYAAAYGHEEIANLLIDAGAERNGRTIEGVQPLHCAAAGGNARLVQLLRNVETAEALTRDGSQLLHCAAEGGNAELMQSLIDAGYNVNVKTYDHIQPLLLAMVFNRAEVARQLLIAGADINIGAQQLSNFIKRFPVHSSSNMNEVARVRYKEIESQILKAIRTQSWDLLKLINLIVVLGHVEIVELILENQPHLLSQYDNFYKIILLAVQAGHTSLVDYFIEQKADLDVETKNELLAQAMNGRHPELVVLLLEKGADPLTKDSKGRKVLHFLSSSRALTQHQLEYIQRLVKQRPELLNDKDEHAQTPLIYAAQHGNQELVASFIKQHVDLDYAARDVTVNKHDEEEHHPDGFTALHWAALNGDAYLVRLLVEAQANCNARTSDSSLPIHLAARRGHIEVMKVLIEADPLVLVKEDDNGHTPLVCFANYCEQNQDVALEKGDYTFLEKMIRECVEQLESPQQVRLFLYDFLSVHYSFLLRKEYPVSSVILDLCINLVGAINFITNEQGDTLLHHLAREWHSIESKGEMVEAFSFVHNFLVPLMERGGNPQAVNHRGHTALTSTFSKTLPLLFHYAQNECKGLVQERNELQNQVIMLQEELHKALEELMEPRKHPDESITEEDEEEETEEEPSLNSTVRQSKGLGIFQSPRVKNEGLESQEGTTASRTW